MSDEPEKTEAPVERNQAEPLRTALGERYLTYALSTIMHRALPDARDGLKPVHRRILYAMRELRLASNGGFRKSAKISGDVMGNYHPHGDQAIYDAMARLAQDFAVRYRLVDGQGNFGNVDGDNPAAARYTEARLTAHAEALLDGLAEDAVDFRDNYDGTLTEPAVLPAAFPNLLANGASGIAVGMATSIPPHNLDELIEACLLLIRSPDARDETLFARVPGPDFPTGGVLVEAPEAIAQAYATGRGGFRLRAAWVVEPLERGAWQAVVTEIPWGVPKSRLIEKIAEAITAKKVPLLVDVRDESADDIRIVLEPRSRSVDADVMMGLLFRTTDLEVRIPLNMNVLIDGVTPKVCSLREVLRAFLDHRREVLGRRTRHRLARIDDRLEVLEGLIVAFLNLDRVIEIIRYDDAPKPSLMRERWGEPFDRALSEDAYVPPAPGPETLSDRQAEAILNMRLRALRRLEEMALVTERAALLDERAGLVALLGDDAAQWKAIAAELRAVRKTFGATAPGGARRTLIGEAGEVLDIAPEALIEREPITVVLSAMGWIRALNGHQPLDKPLKYKDGDGPAFVLHAHTTDRLLIAGSQGRVYTLPAAALPGGRGQGEPVRLMVDLPNEVSVAALRVHRPGASLLLASSDGEGFVAPEDDILAQTRAGRQVLNLRDGARLAVCRPADGEGGGDTVAVVGENRKMLVFPLSDLPSMARGRGVRLQRYKDGGLSDARTFDLASGLSWLDPAGRTRTVGAEQLFDWTAPRGSAGRMAPRGFPQDNRFD
ncbi:MAG: DNA topoisomerase IV subunit A [Paracoccaceae bacterium]